MTSEETFMQRAIDLAKKGAGTVSPNPLVGCVVTHEGKIIGEGWHKAFGGPHAEVNAIESVKEKSLLRESTVYVNLEPCAHFGKTPPCADLLISHAVKKVVIANKDTNPLVGGGGIKKLNDAGIEVVSGILEFDGRDLNKRFFTFFEKQRPYIILKWAQTADGFIARPGGDSKWISSERSRQLVHRWRSEEDAVLVGTETAAHDDPQLNVRDWHGRSPIRVVIDRSLRLPKTLRLFDNSQKTICYNTQRSGISDNNHQVKLDADHFVAQMLADLKDRNVQSVMIEGGTKTLELFLRDGLWDEARIFESEITFGGGILGPKIHGKLVSSSTLSDDTLKIYEP